MITFLFPGFVFVFSDGIKKTFSEKLFIPSFTIPKHNNSLSPKVTTMKFYHSITKLTRIIHKVIWVFETDNLSLHAAGASFFAIISAVPLASLVLSATGLVIPDALQILFCTPETPESIGTLVGEVLDELRNAPNVSFLSFSAITTLWSASKVISAVKRGIFRIYRSVPSGVPFFHTVRSLFNTLVFVALAVFIILFFIFGSYVENIFANPRISLFFSRLKYPVVFLYMCLLFGMIYRTCAKCSDVIDTRLVHHLPGAVFTSCGWIVFSHFYYLYLTGFPRASYIYGGLGAVCLSILWVYMCALILFMGAQVNKYFALRKKKSL